MYERLLGGGGGGGGGGGDYFYDQLFPYMAFLSPKW